MRKVYAISPGLIEGMVALHGEHVEFLKDVSTKQTLYCQEMLTISCFLKTVVGIMVRRVDIYHVSKFLQSEGSIDHKAFGTA